MALKAEFVALLQNNDIPSESAIREVTESLKAPLNKLREIDIEIHRLCELVENLKIKRQSIQKIIDDHNVILSPVRRLPVDALHEIFFQCLPTHRNPIMESSEAPVLLTRICSSWRAIALSSPRIWSRIHIPLPGDPRFSREYGLITDETTLNTRRQLFAGVLQRRCDVVRRWLSRSGTCPLSISITHPGTLANAPIPNDELSHEMFDVLLSFADRWSDVDISMPEELHSTLQANIQPSMFPSLKSLKVQLSRDYHVNYMEPTHIELLAAPGLRSITIRAAWVPADPVLRPSWNHLTHITFASSITDTFFLVLLQKCPNLVFGHFMVNSLHWPDEPHMDQVDQDIVLPCLESLAVIDSGREGFMSIIFKAILAPALTRLSYHWFSSHSRDDDSIPLPAPVIPLLSKSTIISNLLLGGELSSQDIKEILRRGEQVTHIVFDKPPPSNGYRPTDPYTARPDAFDLKLLLINSSAETPLPRLESLEAYFIASFTDEDILNLIKTRVDAFKRGEATALKSVKIYFQRRKQQDIIEEVSRLAKEADIEVKLDLVYVLKGFAIFDRLSPSFGLLSNDRMWSSEFVI